MFEGFLTEALLAAVGRFVDVQKDKLKISLWGGKRQDPATLNVTSRHTGGCSVVEDIPGNSAATYW